MADDVRDFRRGSSIYGVVFWDFVDRACMLQKSVVSRASGRRALGNCKQRRSPLTPKLAIAAVAIKIKRARLCKDFTKISL